MTSRLFLSRENRQRLLALSRAWRLRAPSSKEPAVLHGNALAVEEAVTAADEAEFQAQRFAKGELVLADVHRELTRASRRGRNLTRKELQRLAHQLDDAHDLLRPPTSIVPVV